MPAMPRRELFPFRYRCPRTGKWQHARYKAERHEIAERYPQGWEITGEPMVIGGNPDGQMFSPFRNPSARSHLPAGEPPQNDPPRPENEPGKDPPVKEPPTPEPPVEEPPSEDPATLSDLERFLLAVFVRRYITQCARRRRSPR